MSRKGNKAIKLDSDVTVTNENNVLAVKGPKGELTMKIREDYGIKIEDNLLNVINNAKTKDSKAFHGLYQSKLANMVEGVTKGFEKEIQLVGIGFRAQKKGDGVQFALGYSHPITFDTIEGISLDIEGQTTIFVKGIDKEKVGEVAAKIVKLRDARKDPYKAKGVKLKETIIRKKAGKKVK